MDRKVPDFRKFFSPNSRLEAGGELIGKAKEMLHNMVECEEKLNGMIHFGPPWRF